MGTEDGEWELEVAEEGLDQMWRRTLPLLPGYLPPAEALMPPDATVEGYAGATVELG
ncbi:hypothetical protein NDI39_03985 [Microcoleus sp. ZQ-A2]